MITVHGSGSQSSFEDFSFGRVLLETRFGRGATHTTPLPPCEYRVKIRTRNAHCEQKEKKRHNGRFSFYQLAMNPLGPDRCAFSRARNDLYSRETQQTGKLFRIAINNRETFRVFRKLRTDERRYKYSANISRLFFTESKKQKNITESQSTRTQRLS